MKPLTGWFRQPPADPPTLQERLAALNAGSPDLIRETALGGEEEALRVAAVHLLPDGADLRRLAGLAGAADAPSLASPLQRAAQERVAELIESGSIDFAQFCTQAKDREELFSIVALCTDGSRLTQALAAVDDPGKLAKLIMEGSTSRLRQAAAEQVQDPEQLRQLIKHARDKDRSVYKILKEKHDALIAADRQAADYANEVSALCASLEQQATRVYDPLYAPTFEHLQSRWRSLTTQPPADLEQRVNQAVERCREVIALNQRQAAQQAAERAAADTAAQAARDQREAALEAARESAAAQAETEATLRQEAAAARAAEEAARAAERAAADRLLRQIGGLIRNANGALSEGNTQKAAGMRRAIEEKLPAPAALPVSLTKQLQQLDGKLKELRQWKDFAVAPKRIELIEAMEALIGSPEKPQVLAELIKSLQKDWQTISKGIAGDAPLEWQRFHQASRAAYQPCHDYFEAQTKLRSENLQRRKEVLARLAAFEAAQDAQNPDSRLLLQVLREAPLEWRRYFPVERDVEKSVQRDFEASMGRLHAMLDTWYGRNAADKQSLIKRARLLLAQDDGREAIEGVKRLQIEWKETGPAAREQHQSLWNEFREACDAVFQRRQQAFAEYAGSLEANKHNAVALCEAAESVASLTGPALIAAVAKIPEWRSAFDALGELPRTEARGLQDRFERALAGCKAQLTQQRQRDTEESHTNLLEAGRRIRAYEWAVMSSCETSECEALKTAAETFMAGVQHWPKGGLQALQETWAKAHALSAADTAAREKALRSLCIRCEIQREIPTPQEDEALRREYQVQRLMQRMGQGNRADEGDWDGMLLEWIRIGAIVPAVHESLQDRFVRCRAVRPREPERSVERPVGRQFGREKEAAPSARTRRRYP